MEVWVMENVKRRCGWSKGEALREGEQGKHARPKVTLFLILLLWTLPLSAVAQGWYWGSPVAPGYDRNAVVEMEGLVLQADLSARRGGTSLQMEAGGETVTVTLGPAWYLRRQGADIISGDRLLVRGAKAKTQEGKVFLTAATVTNRRTGRVLNLRDEEGRPLWLPKKQFPRELTPEGRP